MRKQQDLASTPAALRGRGCNVGRPPKAQLGVGLFIGKRFSLASLCRKENPAVGSFGSPCPALGHTRCPGGGWCAPLGSGLGLALRSAPCRPPEGAAAGLGAPPARGPSQHRVSEFIAAVLAGCYPLHHCCWTLSSTGPLWLPGRSALHRSILAPSSLWHVPHADCPWEP